MYKNRYLVKLLRLGAVFGLLAGLFVAAPLLAVSGVNGDSPASGDFAPDRILVKFKPGAEASAKQDVHGRHGGQVVGEISALGVQVVRVAPGQVKKMAQDYGRENAVQFAEPDYLAYAIGTPDDTFFVQWNMAKIQAPQAWDITTGNPSIKIAILDTGIDQDHVDLPLGSKIVTNQMNFTNSDTVDDRYGHGTHVAGIAAASTNNGVGVAGVGYNSSLMNVKVLGDSGSGPLSGVAAGIVWAADNGAKVINMSLGATMGEQTLEDAVNYAWGKGVVLVAAAGNFNSTVDVYPARYDNVIAVAATDPSDARASFSSYGPWVDVAAPGVGIFSTLPNQQNQQGGVNYGTLSGTSMSSPHVAGLAGLLWASQWGTTNSNVIIRQRIELMADQAGTMWSQYGIRRINAFAAVGDTPTPTPALVSIAVTPGAASIQQGSTLQFTATGNFSDGSTANLTTTATWASANTSVATISASGLATGVGGGTAGITATQNGIVSNIATLTVTVPPTLVSIAVTPGAASIQQGSTQQFTATGTFSDSSTANLTTTATWASANTSVATISASGLATGVGEGTTGITATQNGIVSNSAGLTVTPPPTGIFADGFENGVVPPWTRSWVPSGIARSNEQQREGSYSVKASLPTSSKNAYVEKDLTLSYGTLYVRAYVYVDSFVTIQPSANTMLALRRKTTTPSVDATYVSLGLRNRSGAGSNPPWDLWVSYNNGQTNVNTGVTITSDTWTALSSPPTGGIAARAG
ncbi:MAG: S8 family serine peptidase [Chloroflexota bacterium]